MKRRCAARAHAVETGFTLPLGLFHTRTTSWNMQTEIEPPRRGRYGSAPFKRREELLRIRSSTLTFLWSTSAGNETVIVSLSMERAQLVRVFKVAHVMGVVYTSYRIRQCQWCSPKFGSCLGGVRDTHAVPILCDIKPGEKTSF